MKKYYTGIGSRKTPKKFLDMIEKISIKLEKEGYILRSGGAEGADIHFEKNVKNKEIYLGWKGFNNNSSNLFKITKEALELASKFHPNWENLKPGAKKLMARNCYQVLGYDLKTPSKFVICWTQDGCQTNKERTYKTGGTGLAISLADYYNIPVFNLANKESFERLYKFIENNFNNEETYKEELNLN